MPVKTFSCAICGKQITRPKSWSMSNGGRACRDHEEACKTHETRERMIAEERREARAKAVSATPSKERPRNSFESLHEQPTANTAETLQLAVAIMQDVIQHPCTAEETQSAGQ